MSAVSPIQSRVPNDEYRALPALNISALKEMQKSPLHFRHALVNPRTSPAMTLGTAGHCATLEPERFARDYAIWSSRTASGRMSPRTGKAWDAFVADQGGKLILTEDECSDALAIAAAVRADPVAAKYLSTGEPEVTLSWSLHGRACKGRVDWLTHIDGGPVIVGLKTARECRHFAFGAAAAKLGYALQWAWYHDGLHAIKPAQRPRMIEIVVESAPPHAVVVYVIPDDILDYGRDEYRRLLDLLAVCERDDHWPGPAETEQVLTLPSWVYGPGDEDLSELQLET